MPKMAYLRISMPQASNCKTRESCCPITDQLLLSFILFFIASPSKPQQLIATPSNCQWSPESETECFPCGYPLITNPLRGEPLRNMEMGFTEQKFQGIPLHLSPHKIISSPKGLLRI